jgi:hypothetical protein
LLVPGPRRAASASQAQALFSASVGHKRVLSYPFDQVWPAAIRYLRVDRGYTLRDRDKSAGYVLFEFHLSGSTEAAPRFGQGSLEMFPTTDPSGRPSVQLRVSTTAGPIHLAHTILEGVAAKVRAERGQPPPPPAEPPSAPAEPPPRPSDPPDQPPPPPPSDPPDQLPARPPSSR